MTPQRFGPRKDPKDWIPHRGPFKVIKLKPTEGIEPPTLDENGKHIVRTNVDKEDW